ncbi:hypothetical protein KVR01_006790 [Diaporthe batatas]|uniref:uncharacterized protein n=1 Tax=Diaporthe batatas TaxID=748121 RepID=UPI001D055EA2|nr:uncharacterized protein KVR01_006790 [Diaporthe batatas]KAG8163493.1 hypothetical protein KVR01_006790 [Diaporthe batatas]
MPFDFDRIIDHQLYLATQQCIQPHVLQQRRVSSAPVPSTVAAAAAAAAGVGPARAAGVRKSSLGSLVSPWSPFSDGSSNGSSSSSGNPRALAAYSYQTRRQQGSSPIDLFFAEIPLLGGRGHYGRGVETPLARDDSSSSLDHFVTAPVGDFSAGAGAGGATELLPPPPLQHRNGTDSGPGSSDTDDWAFATASGGSAAGTCSGLDTTVDLTPSPPPSSSSFHVRKRVATYMTAAAPKPSDRRNHPAGPASARVPAPAEVSVITLPVRDLQRAKRFYERVFGTPCLSSSGDGKSAALHLNNGALVVTLLESEEKGCRGGNGQVVLLTVSVDDVEEVYRRLRCFEEEAEGADGMEDVAIPGFSALVSRPWGLPVIMFSDPAGNRWRVSQETESS